MKRKSEKDLINDLDYTNRIINLLIRKKYKRTLSKNDLDLLKSVYFWMGDNLDNNIIKISRMKQRIVNEIMKRNKKTFSCIIEVDKDLGGF